MYLNLVNVNECGEAKGGVGRDVGYRGESELSGAVVGSAQAANCCDEADTAIRARRVGYLACLAC